MDEWLGGIIPSTFSADNKQLSCSMKPRLKVTPFTPSNDSCRGPKALSGLASSYSFLSLAGTQGLLMQTMSVYSVNDSWD